QSIGAGEDRGVLDPENVPLLRVALGRGRQRHGSQRIEHGHGQRVGLEAAHDTATGEAANGLVAGKCLGNRPDIAEAQIEQLLQGLHGGSPSVVPSILQAKLLYLGSGAAGNAAAAAEKGAGVDNPGTLPRWRSERAHSASRGAKAHANAMDVFRVVE